jgi:hypothetical protein
LISSASRSSVKIGPRVRVNVLVWKLNRLVPMMSPGMRSGVNCTRPKPSDKDAANARPISVFATPGTPSSRTWPSASRLTSSRSIA